MSLMIIYSHNTLICTSCRIKGMYRFTNWYFTLRCIQIIRGAQEHMWAAVMIGHYTYIYIIHWSPVNSPHKGQWRRALMFSLICAWTNGGANHRDAGDLRRNRAHYGVTLMTKYESWTKFVWGINKLCFIFIVTHPVKFLCIPCTHEWSLKRF